MDILLILALTIITLLFGGVFYKQNCAIHHDILHLVDSVKIFVVI